MTEVGRQQSFVDASNSLVPMTLGLLNLLDDLASGVAESQPHECASASKNDELLIAALLGLLSVRRTVHRWTDPIVLKAEVVDNQEALAVDIQPSGLMR